MRLLELAPSEAAGSLQMLSGAKAILFCVRSNIEVLTLADRRRRTVLQKRDIRALSPRWILRLSDRRIDARRPARLEDTKNARLAGAMATDVERIATGIADETRKITAVA